MHKFNHDFSCILAIFAVSLFTREWIEINQNQKYPYIADVFNYSCDFV